MPDLSSIKKYIYYVTTKTLKLYRNQTIQYNIMLSIETIIVLKAFLNDIDPNSISGLKHATGVWDFDAFVRYELLFSYSVLDRTSRLGWRSCRTVAGKKNKHWCHNKIIIIITITTIVGFSFLLSGWPRGQSTRPAPPPSTHHWFWCIAVILLSNFFFIS